MWSVRMSCSGGEPYRSARCELSIYCDYSRISLHYLLINKTKRGNEPKLVGLVNGNFTTNFPLDCKIIR